MAKHQLIISDGPYPVRSEAGQNTPIWTLVVNWKGSWGPGDRPERYLVVAPGDELELVLPDEKRQGCTLWISHKETPLLEPTEGIKHQDEWDRVDIKSGSRVVRVNPALAGASEEARYNVRATPLGQKPLRIVGQGAPGTLTATKP